MAEWAYLTGIVTSGSLNGRLGHAYHSKHQEVMGILWHLAVIIASREEISSSME